MRILFLNGTYPFCYYVRGYLPGVYSGNMVVREFLVGEPNTQAVLEQAKKADVVVMQRPNSEKFYNIMHSLKALGKKVIFENDDTYLVGKGIDLDRLENDKQRELAKEISAWTNKCLALADGAIASTPILAEEYSQTNPNVCVLKNCIDPLDEFPCKENTTGKFRVGFVGSVTTNDDYIHIKDQIKQLDDRGDVTIVVFGIKYKDGSHISFMKEDLDFWSTLKNVEWQPYVPVTSYMMTLAKLSLDLAIIPRNENYFNACKSNLKFLEMSLLKIPVLAQGFSNGLSPYQGADEPYLTLVHDNSQWYNTIVTIKDAYSEYKQKAIKAHEYVLQEYNIKNYATQWVDKIKQLCNYQKNSLVKQTTQAHD
jgi:glycosyltransferase involved in cell wall biosynthesis